MFIESASRLTDLYLSGAYPRPLDPSAYPLHYPYNMAAAAKGNGLDSEGGSVKKPRTVFTPKQLLHLEEEFVKNQFPSMEQRKQIAKDLDLTQQHIQVRTSTNLCSAQFLVYTYKSIVFVYEFQQ